MLLVLMTSWLTSLDMADNPPVEILELFAGKARITRLARRLGIPAEAHDWDYDKASIESKGSLNNSMDITGPAGLVTLSNQLQCFFWKHLQSSTVVCKVA